ncbi:MAG: T9SS type A sorting domain-containing protein [Ferruginibacter sp.]
MRIIFNCLCGILLTTTSFYTSFAQVKPTSVVTGKLISTSRQIKDIPVEKIISHPDSKREFGENDIANKRVKFNVDNPFAISADVALQPKRTGQPASPAVVGITFDGNGQVDNAALGFPGYTPPDPTLAVGPNHIVQMVNVAHSVYNKAGTRLAGPLKFSSIASTATDDGDPIALYDQAADRFLLLQFSNVGTGSDALIFCISKTADPTGAYYIYSFPTVNTFPDYPHIGIWNNSYVITTHEFNIAGTAYLGQGYYAVDRRKMIAGAATSTMIRFNVAADGGYLPACLEGSKTPESTSPPMFLGWDSDETGAASDRLMMRTLSADFTTPGLSTLSVATIFNTASFDGRSPTSAAISQLGSAVALDHIADRMMSRVIYRRFDNYEALVMNHVVNVSGSKPNNANSYQAGMRWYEMRRNTPAGAWSIYQQGTYTGGNPAADGTAGIDSWMGGTCIDQKGNIALAYSSSGSTRLPSIYYGERLVGDPLNTLNNEAIFYAGGGVQTSSGNRWGDYSSINVDPADEDSIWFTSEYYATTSATGFKTRIGKFKIAAPVSPEVHFATGGTICRPEEAVILKAGSNCLRYKDYPIILKIDQAPSQPATLILSSSGTATAGTDYDLIFTNPIILNSVTASATVTLRVYDDAQNEEDEYINLSYSLNSNAGNSVAAGYNQLHRVTIMGRTGVSPGDYALPLLSAPVTIYSDNFDAVPSGLGAWTEQVVQFTGTTNLNHFIVGSNFGTGFVGKALYVSDDNSNIHYTAVSPGVNGNKIIIRAVSPTIVTTGKKQVTVNFDYKALGETPAYDYGSLFYSIDDGTTWANASAGLKLQSQTSVVSQSVLLPVNAENITTLKIGFQWENDFSLDKQPPLGVDNVVVTGKTLTSNTNIAIVVNAGLSTTGSFNFGPGQVVHFVDTLSKKIMASITNSSAHNFGCTKVEIDRAGTNAVAFNSNVTAQRLASKTFKIIPEFNNTSASYSIRLYYTEAEIAGWETVTGLSRSALKIVKVNGNNSISNVTPASQAGYVYSVNPATIASFGTDGITLDATLGTGFSGFGVGNPLSVVPVALLKFSGEHINGKGNRLYWNVANQVNVKEYELQYSPDGQQFTTVGIIPARQATNNDMLYEYLHLNYRPGSNFYRLKPVDIDGHYTLSDIVLLTVQEKGKTVFIYPNPVADKLMINYRGLAAKIIVQVTDAAGKIMMNKEIYVNGISFVDVSKFAVGSYVVSITDEEGVTHLPFVKK